jgi:hypothetical protein
MLDQTLFDRFDEELTSQAGKSRRDALSSAGSLGAGLLMAAAIPSVFRSLITPNLLHAQQAQPTVEEILRFALTLEYLEFEFYERGLLRAGLIPAADRTIFQVFRDHELDHVRFLEELLGLSRDAAKPDFDFTAGGAFPNWNTDYATYRALAQGFEDTGVRAYKGQAPNLINNKVALTAALQIHSVEGRHASVIRRRNGNYTEQAPQKGWITGRQTGVVPATVGATAVGNAIYGPGSPAANFPAEDNVMQGGVDLRTLTFSPALEGTPVDKITESFDEPLDMQTVLAIAGLFIRS